MKTLRIGDTGEDVMMLQKLLGVHADGLFGKNTETALKMFQAHNRLDVDGIAGPKTWAALLGGGLKKSSRKINEIIIHCTATPDGKDVTVEAIRNYHMKQRGWSDITTSSIVTARSITEGTWTRLVRIQQTITSIP